MNTQQIIQLILKLLKRETVAKYRNKSSEQWHFFLFLKLKTSKSFLQAIGHQCKTIRFRENTEQPLT